MVARSCSNSSTTGRNRTSEVIIIKLHSISQNSFFATYLFVMERSAPAQRKAMPVSKKSEVKKTSEPKEELT